MTGAPGLDPAIGNREALGNFVQLLIDVGNIKEFFHAAANVFLKIFFDLMLDDKSDFPESGLISVIQGEVNDLVAFVVHGGDLLETAEAAAHTGGHNDQSGFRHRNSSIFFCFSFLLSYTILDKDAIKKGLHLYKIRHIEKKSVWDGQVFLQNHEKTAHGLTAFA